MTNSLVLLSGSVHPWVALLFYADPGSGMLIWQLATAAALGLMFYARTFLRKIRLLRQSRAAKEDHEPPAGDN
jgi:heme/copper-type cytochrome/quinol oxidase subunit 3